MTSGSNEFDRRKIIADLKKKDIEKTDIITNQMQPKTGLSQIKLKDSTNLFNIAERIRISHTLTVNLFFRFIEPIPLLNPSPLFIFVLIFLTFLFALPFTIALMYIMAFIFLEPFQFLVLILIGGISILFIYVVILPNTNSWKKKHFSIHNVSKINPKYISEITKFISSSYPSTGIPILLIYNIYNRIKQFDGPFSVF